MAEFGERGGNRNGAFWITQGQAGCSKWTFSTPRICRSSMHQPGSHYCQAIKRTYVPSVAKKVTELLELELQVVVSSYWRAENQTLVIYKSSKYSLPWSQSLQHYRLLNLNHRN